MSVCLESKIDMDSDAREQKLFCRRLITGPF